MRRTDYLGNRPRARRLRAQKNLGKLYKANAAAEEKIKELFNSQRLAYLKIYGKLNHEQNEMAKRREEREAGL